MKEFEYSGFWWIPSNPQHKLKGHVKFEHEEGVTLKINGLFSNNLESQNIILGETQNKKITLYNCFVTVQEYIPNIIQEYTVTTIFIGHHFDEYKNIKFSKFQAGYTYLNYLSQLANVQGKISILDDVLANIAIIQLEDIQSNQQNYLGNSILFDMEFTQSWILDEILEKFVNPLRYFINLVTDQPNDITELYLWLPDKFALYSRIEVIFSTVKMANKTKSLSKHKFFLELNELKQHFSLIIQKWFNLNNKINDILNLYFNAYYNEDVYIQNKFLSAIQTLEAYHRRQFDHKFSNADEHKKKVEEILEFVPEKHKDWLKEKLSFSYEPSLDDRLNQLLNLTSKSISPIIKNRQSFIKKLKDNRNYLTHYDKSLRAKVASPQDLLKIHFLLDFIFKDCLLYELGYSPERREELMSRHPVYKYIKENPNEFNVV